MEFDNTLEVPLPPDEAWKVLLDIKRIAACIPGAELTEVVDDTTYRGKVAVRLGPVALSLAGHAKLEEVDETARRVRVKTHGADPKGRGGADSVIDFRLEPAGAATRVLIHSDVKLSGSIAQYGRGSGMIQSMASQLIAQFGEALKMQIASGESAPARPVAGLSMLGKAAWESIAGASAKKSPDS